jgi:hypothetical protein
MPNLRPKIQDYRLGLVYGGAYLNFLVICSHWNKITPTLSSPPSSPVTGNQELNPDTISFDGSNYATLTGESSCLFFSSFVLKTRPNGFWKLFRFDSKGQRLKKKWTRTISRAFSKTLIVNGTVWCAHPQYPGHIRSMHVGAGYREQLHVEICCLAWESSARSFPFSQNTRAAAINWLRVSHYLSLTTPATVL